MKFSFLKIRTLPATLGSVLLLGFLVLSLAFPIAENLVVDSRIGKFFRFKEVAQIERHKLPAYCSIVVSTRAFEEGTLLSGDRKQQLISQCIERKLAEYARGGRQVRIRAMDRIIPKRVRWRTHSPRATVGYSFD